MPTSPRLLVTGATGQLGGLVIDALLKTRPAAEIAGLVREGGASSKSGELAAPWRRDPARRLR